MNDKYSLKEQIKTSYSGVVVDDITTKRMLGGIMKQVKKRKEKKQNKIFAFAVGIQAVVVAAVLIVIIFNGTKLNNKIEDDKNSNGDLVAGSNVGADGSEIENITDAIDNQQTEATVNTSVTEETNSGSINTTLTDEEVKLKLDEMSFNFYVQNLLKKGSLDAITNNEKLFFVLQYMYSLNGDGNQVGTEIKGSDIVDSYNQSMISNLSFELGDIGYFGDESKRLFIYDSARDVFSEDKSFNAMGYSTADTAASEITSFDKDGDVYKAKMKILFMENMMNPDAWTECDVYTSYEDAINNQNPINLVKEFIEKNPEGSREDYYKYVMDNSKNLKEYAYDFVINEGGNINLINYSIE